MGPGQEETPKCCLWWGWGGIKAKTRLLGTPPSPPLPLSEGGALGPTLWEPQSEQKWSHWSPTGGWGVLHAAATHRTPGDNLLVMTPARGQQRSPWGFLSPKAARPAWGLGSPRMCAHTRTCARTRIRTGSAVVPADSYPLGPVRGPSVEPIPRGGLGPRDMRPPHLGPAAFVGVPAPCPLPGMRQAGGVWRVWRVLPTRHTADGTLCSLGSRPSSRHARTQAGWSMGTRLAPALVSRGSADLQHSLRERLRAEGASCRPRPGCSGQSHGRPARHGGSASCACACARARALLRPCALHVRPRSAWQGASASVRGSGRLVVAGCARVCTRVPALAASRSSGWDVGFVSV